MHSSGRTALTAPPFHCNAPLDVTFPPRGTNVTPPSMAISTLPCKGIRTQLVTPSAVKGIEEHIQCFKSALQLLHPKEPLSV